MKLKTTFSYINFILLTFVSTASFAGKQGGLAQCQYVQNPIAYYTDLKRAGGSASQMNFWHKSRNEYKAQFTNSSLIRIAHSC